MAVNQAQVAYVEGAGKWLLFKLGYANKREPRNVRLEPRRIREEKLIAQHTVLVVKLTVEEDTGQGLKPGHGANGSAKLLKRNLTGHVSLRESDDFRPRRNTFCERRAECRVDDSAALCTLHVIND